MPYMRKRVVMMDIKSVSPGLLYDFEEFLRRKMITPVTRPMKGNAGEKGLSYYTGFFTFQGARKVDGWLRRHRVDRET